MTIAGRVLARVLLLRRGVQALDRLADAVDRQTLLLEKLATHLLPVIPTAASKVELSDTGVSYHDPLEAAITEEYVERVTREMGRAPTEEEILSYLADEKTVSLHARLKERETLLRQQPRSRAELG